MVVIAHANIQGMILAFTAAHHLPLLGDLVSFNLGELGVSIFFVISGFLITTLLIRTEDAQGRVSLKNFYLRRFFRIFPPYYAYLGVVGILALLGLVPMLRGAYVAAVFYVTNYYPYRLSVPTLPAGWLVGHSWTLSLEEQFYLIWPACLHWLGRRRAAVLGLILMVLTPISRAATLHLYPDLLYGLQVDRMFHTRIDTLIVGAVLALLGTWPRAYSLLIRWRSKPWTGAVAALALYYTLFLGNKNVQFEGRMGITLDAVLIAYLIAFCIQHAHTAGGRLLNAAWLRHIGVISYSLYLWQQLFVGAGNILPGHWVLDVSAILLMAEISHYAVERPSFVLRDWVLARRT